MRSLSAISLIVLMFLNLFGSYFIFWAERDMVRKEVKQILKSEKKKNVQQFVFTETEYAQLKKHRGGKEFSLNGNMYDIVKIEHGKGEVVLLAYFDHRETQLIEKFMSLLDGDTDAKTNPHHYKSRIAFTEFIQTTFSLQIFLTTSLIHPYFQPASISKLSVDITSPPPERIS